MANGPSRPIEPNFNHQRDRNGNPILNDFEKHVIKIRDGRTVSTHEIFILYRNRTLSAFALFVYKHANAVHLINPKA